MSNAEYSPDELLVVHRQMNKEIFDTLGCSNSVVNSVMRIDFYFFSEDLVGAQERGAILIADLRYEVKLCVAENDDGEEFFLEGVCLNVPLEIVAIDCWVEKMIHLGAAYRSSFGGWGFKH